jgi:hypothetical protein
LAFYCFGIYLRRKKFRARTAPPSSMPAPYNGLAGVGHEDTVLGHTEVSSSFKTLAHEINVIIAIKKELEGLF